MTLEQFKKKMPRIPDTPGVYFFLARNKKVLYIGKATSLRDRTRSYFAPDLLDTRGQLIAAMVARASSLAWRQTDSVLEALLLEASLVRSQKPPYNTDLKDGKSFNYVVVTRETFPRVLVVRGKNLAGAPKAKKVFGPFPHGGQLKEAMRLIRRIFPYRDACTPPAGGGGGRPCFNRELGLCPGVCMGELGPRDYARTVRHLVLLFEGKKPLLLRSLERQMRAAAKRERFEEAKELNRQRYALQHIQDVSLIKDEYRSPSQAGMPYRIEAYDVAHLRGSSNVGVMAVVEDGVANKAEYRKFRIRTAKGGDDVGALREILSRRLGHDEWPLPRLIAVDGALAQLKAAQRVLAEYGMAIPVVGVVKDERHRPREVLGDRELVAAREREILLANAEAHRFAIAYHRRTSRRNLAL